MGDPNEQGRNQEFAPMEKSNNSNLRWIWCHGLNSLWNTIFTGIVVCALLLALPPLVLLSVLEFVLSAPSGFMFLVCPAINEIMCILLGEPKPKIPLYSVCEDLWLCSDDLEKEDDKYDEEKAKEKGYEQDYDLKEEEKELEDDTRRAVEARMEDHSSGQTSGQLGIREASKDFEEVIVDKVEEDEYEEVKEYRKESDDGAENDIDIEVVKEIDAFELGMRTKDSSTTTVEYDNVERENSEKEKKREIRADEEQDEDKNVAPSTQMTSPFLSWESSGSFGNLEELLAPPEDETADGFQEDCDEVEEQQSPKIEPGELVKETMEMVEAVRNEGKVEIENIQQSMEEATSILPAVSGSVDGAVLDLERVKLLAVEDCVDDIPRLQTINEQMESGKVKKKDDALASLQVEFEHTTNATMKVNTQKMEQLNLGGDIWNATYRSMGYEKKFEGIGAENRTFGMKGDKG